MKPVESEMNPPESPVAPSKLPPNPTNPEKSQEPINSISKVDEVKIDHKCTLCYANFSDLCLLKKHQEEFHNFSKILHKCLDCDYSCFNKHSLKDHIAHVHERKNLMPLPNIQKRSSKLVRVELGSKKPYIDATQVSLMPYPCSQFYADIKSDIRFDNRFYIRLWNSFHVKPNHKS